MNQKHKNTWTLFRTFFKIGAFTFGGGYAMIPLIQKEICEKHGWITQEDILDIIAIAESTPGPIAINSATFVGYKVCGFTGAAAATLGVVLPSFAVILMISFILQQFSSLAIVSYAFSGIRAGVLALLLRALISMYKQCPHHLISCIIMGASFLAVAFVGINVLPVLCCCAVVGLSYTLIRERKARQ